MTTTARQLDVLRRLARRGATTKSVAHELGISPSAARRRLSSLYRNLGVDNALQAYAYVKEIGERELDDHAT